MKGKILHFRQNRHTTQGNQMIVSAEGVEGRDDAEKLVGKQVVFDTGKNTISGTVASAHGNSGALRVRFDRGMPGQAIGQTVDIK